MSRLFSLLVPRHRAWSILALVLISLSVLVEASNEAENARWLIRTSTWATLSWIPEGDDDDDDVVNSAVVSFAEKNGDIFVAVPRGDEFRGALTFSEAQIDPSQFEGARCGPDGALDPEDPRCAKLTVSGTLRPVAEADADAAHEIMFATHPEMESWPKDHGCTMFRLEVESVWMIANYGGGGNVPVDDFRAARPVRHAVKNFGDRRRRADATTRRRRRRLERPAFRTVAAHARWLVSRSLWTTVSTNGSERMGVDGQAWGNVRSTHDGECLASSSGSPVFYLPNPDPTHVDVDDDAGVSLSFTEAALAVSVTSDGSMICDTADPGSPTCAKISLRGTARPLTDDELGYAMKVFQTTHPRGAWLSSGGGHTGGTYYTIDVESVEFFRDFGEATDLTVEEYLAWTPSLSEPIPADELLCDARTVIPLQTPSSSESGHEHGGGGGSDVHGDGTGEGGGGEDANEKNWRHGPHAHNGGGYGPGNHSGGSYWGGGFNGRYDRSKGGDQKKTNMVVAETKKKSEPEPEPAVEKEKESMKDTNDGIRTNDEKPSGRGGSSWFSLPSFSVGTVFGIVVWAPAMVMFVYFKYHEHNNIGRNEEPYVPVTPSPHLTSAQVV